MAVKNGRRLHMIYYDTTKMGPARHRSGLMRLTSRLREQFGSTVTEVAWDSRRRAFVGGSRREPIGFAPLDWFLTVELFSEAERPGFREFVAKPPCRIAAVYHDAIPVRYPHITWPQSVQRHPDYMKMLARFERTWAISEATRQDFAGFWHWQGVMPRSRTEVLPLGADFDESSRVRRDPVIPSGRACLLCVGIVEPRKNQEFLLDVAQELWGDGADFDLHIVGRVNPHFGTETQKRMAALMRTEPRFRHHSTMNDRELARLYAGARAVVFPTIAEGCGLPLLEALWRGVPCVCTDLPVLRENADGGGCLPARLNDPADWKSKLRTVLDDHAAVRRLQSEAMSRPLPRWTESAQVLLRGLAR